MAKKKNNIMLLAGAAAVAAYFMFKNKIPAVKSGAAATGDPIKMNNLRTFSPKAQPIKKGMGRGRNLDINGNSPIF